MHLFMEVCHTSVRILCQLSRVSHLDQRSDILVLDSALALELVESSAVAAISHRLVLEITFASLVANGAIERVVCQEELHDAFSCLVDERGVGLDNHSRLYRPCAGRHGLRSTLDLDQAHTTTSSNHQLLVVAVSWDGYTGLFAGLDESGAGCSGALGPCLKLHPSFQRLHTFNLNLLAICEAC